jgi:hypothetical protein
MNPNWHLITRNGYSVFVRKLALIFSALSNKLPQGEFFSGAPCLPKRLPYANSHLWILPAHRHPGSPYPERRLVNSFATDHDLGCRHDVGFCVNVGVDQPRIGIQSNVCLYFKVQLVAALDLVHLGGSLPSAVGGGAGRGNQGGIHHSAGVEQQAFGGEGTAGCIQQLDNN